MIVDELTSWRSNYRAIKGLGEAFNFLEKKANEKLPAGRHDIDDDTYALSSKYTTKSAVESQFETHRKYIDIQYIISGEEVIEWAPMETLQANSEYNSEKDYTLYNRTDRSSRIKMYPGYFMVLFPTDGHMPGCQLNGPAEVHKVVLKVSVDLL